MYRFASFVSVSRVDEETVLLNSRTGKYYGLNAVGSRYCELLDTVGDTDAIVAKMLEEYDVDEARLRQDIESLQRDLISHGLIESFEPHS